MKISRNVWITMAGLTDVDFIWRVFYNLSGLNRVRIYTHLTNKEKVTLYCLGRSVSSGSRIVEIGSYLGASSLVLAKAVRNSLVYCVDTWENDAMSEGKRDTFQEFQNNTREFSKKIVPLRGLSSLSAKKHCGMIDLVFFDGDHSYHAVKSDWLLWKKFLVKGSVVIFHDWGWAEGVKRVINEMVDQEVECYSKFRNIWWGIKR